MRLSEIAKITGGRLMGKDVEVSGFSIDSRTVKKGQCFVAIKGSRHDGHDFVKDAFNKGASSVIVAKEININIPQVVVRDTVEALQCIAFFKRKNFKGKVIGVVGSAGKTTTKDLIHFVLSKFGKSEKTEGNLNSHIGLPLCMANMDETADFWVLEHGASAVGDIRRLVKITRPHIGVVTAIGEEHLETFKSLDGVIRGNLEIASFMEEGDFLIVPHSIKDKVNKRVKLITFGRGGDIEASDIMVSYDGTKFKLMGRDVYVPVVSVAIVDNILACAGVLKALGRNITSLIPIVKDFKPSVGRMNLIKRGSLIVIDDSYNSNPLSLRNALLTLSLFPLKKVAILGDMLELGDYSERLHREIGKYIAELGIDRVIFYGNEMKYAWEESFKRSVNAKYMETKADILAEISKMGKESTVFLVKGSRGMKMEEIVNYLLQGE